MRAKLHPRQTERLAHLRKLGILDTAAETQFDEIVDLASRICEVPVALISLVDEDRQWFKARVGTDDPQTDLDRSICSHVILQGDLVEIPDTTLDVRTADNPLVVGEDHIRFYAGMPLISDDGLPIGTLCVLDRTPRVLTDLQRTTLRVLAGQLMRQVELGLALHQAEVLRGEIDHRVKNSLQTVLSVVRMYKSRVHNDVAIEALAAVERRIDAVAMLHQELYQTSQSNLVALAPYMVRVASLLEASAPSHVRLDMNVSQVQVPSSMAANIGMIISEFTANAIKHAFPDGRRGTVAISVEQTDDQGALRVHCRDDGIGNANPAEENEVTRLGQRLMQAAALQIGADFALEARADGYHLTMLVALTNDFNAEVAAE
ncbi:sensor histidine kinase [Pseudosulfitobacter koreensis]|uniref:GAF domain-containing protein n=1 Tax=Pseudosulfitobacter koreensis TaxID=2968472 RepID=A0ABT1Z2F1_9RHOB|nr:histidine kinase dimerization/phosphoacceptor domain -containing protein [Pseudosulfitobacter koreense]MCR8827314.1 GAF domain-containing protein [Pseudosulfitobacter koreense]